MGANPIPMPDQQGQAAQTLQQILQGRQVSPTGSTSVGPQIPTPQPRQMLPTSPNGGAPQGNFQSKGQHQRASMQSLAGSVQNLVAAVGNAHQQQQNKQLGQKFQTLIGSQKGMQAADEMTKNAQAMLQQDPDNAQAKQMLQDAQQMKQHNTTVLNQLLDPNTPEGKKNIKLFSKGFGFDDKNADTPERAAAIAAMKQVQTTAPPTPQQVNLPNNSPMPGPQQQMQMPGAPQATTSNGLNSGAASMLSRFPQGIGMSPQTQVNTDMVRAGVTPKAATGGQVLGAQMKAAVAVGDQAIKAEKVANDAGMKTDQLVSKLPAMGLQAIKNPDGSIARNPDGTMKTRNITMEELKDNPELAGKYAQEQTKTNLQVAQAQATTVRAQVAQMREKRLREQQQQMQQPGQLQQWAKLVSDPTSGVTLAQVPAAARGAVVNAVASGGMKIAKPLSSDEIKRMDLANNAVQNIEEAQSILAKRPDMFGPGGYGKTKFELALAGGDPDAIKYQAAIQLANLPAVGIHGVRGKWALEDLNKLDGNLYLNPESMKGVLGEIHRSAGEFQKMAGRSPQNSGGQQGGQSSKKYQLGNKFYTYNGSGDPSDLKNYSEVKP